MILRRYGNTLQSVDTDFDSKALSEVGFRRDREFSISADEFEETYAEVETHEISAETEGAVQDETQQRLLDEMEAASPGGEARARSWWWRTSRGWTTRRRRTCGRT